MIDHRIHASFKLEFSHETRIFGKNKRKYLDRPTFSNNNNRKQSCSVSSSYEFFYFIFSFPRLEEIHYTQSTTKVFSSSRSPLLSSFLPLERSMKLYPLFRRATWPFRSISNTLFRRDVDGLIGCILSRVRLPVPFVEETLTSARV